MPPRTPPEDSDKLDDNLSRFGKRRKSGVNAVVGEEIPDSHLGSATTQTGGRRVQAPGRGN